MDICLSPARAAASRRNGAKSSGPKTPEGKARSSQNALKHGLRAQKHLVLPGERATEFAALEAALLEELAPEGALQTVLARRVVAAAWRLERAEHLETGLFAWNQLDGGGRNLGLALIRDCNNARAFDTLLRYRGGTLAELWRALRTLKALQAEAATLQAEVGTSAPQVDATAPEAPIEPEATSPGEIAPPRAASEPAPATISCHRASARNRRPDGPERRENPGDSDRPSGRGAPQRGEARPAEPALSLPIELAQGASAAALLAGTALVPLARPR